MLLRAPLLLGLVAACLGACGPALPDDTTGSATGDTSTSTSTSTSTTSTSTSSTSTSSTSATSTTDAPTSSTTTDAPTSSTTGVDPVLCAAAALIELKDPTATPDMGPTWEPGESITIGVTLFNPGPEDFNTYPGIRVTTEPPDITTGMPENWLFALLAGMENTLSVTLQATPDAPAPSTVVFTIEVVSLNNACPDLMKVELPVDLQ